MIGFFVLMYLIVMLYVGIKASRTVKSSSDYVLAGRSLTLYVATATVFATWFGSESILGASGSFAQGGFLNVLQDPFGAGLCLIIAGLFFNARLYRMKFLTIGDFFKARYNSTVSTVLSLAIIVSYFGWVGAQLLALGLVMFTVFGVMSLSWWIVTSFLLVLAYTYYGGMMSVAKLDSIQSVVVVVGLFCITFFAVQYVGGFHSMMALVPSGHLRIIPVNTDSIHEWILYVTAIITMAFGSIPQQDVYQRAMSAESASVSSKASIIGGLLYFTVALLPLVLGVVAASVYPDVLQSDPEHLVAYFVTSVMPGWLQVMFFGALISAIVSTASGSMLAPGTLLAENVLVTVVKRVSDELRLSVIRYSVLFIGVGGLIMALADDVKIYELVASAYTVTLVAAFIPLVFGLYSHKANTLGATMSAIFGVTTWLLFPMVFTSSTLPAAFVGFVFSFVGMLVGTFVGHILVNEERRIAHIAKVKRTLNLE